MSQPIPTPDPDDAALQESFRAVMAGVCTPVSVVTTLHDGAPFGTTVSAFASLSLDPPMVLVSLDQHSHLLAAIRRSRRFGLNVLNDAQAGLATAFAQRGAVDRFAGVAWAADHGVPRIDQAIGFLSCTVADVVAGGDHLIVLGTVMAADAVSGAPLTYHARTFGTHVPAVEPP